MILGVFFMICHVPFLTDFGCFLTYMWYISEHCIIIIIKSLYVIRVIENIKYLKSHD